MKNIIKIIVGAILITSCSGNNGNTSNIGNRSPFYPNFAHSIVYNEDSTQFYVTTSDASNNIPNGKISIRWILVGKDIDNQGKYFSFNTSDSSSNMTNNLVSWGPITKSGVYAIIEKVTIDNITYSASHQVAVKLKKHKN